MKIFFWTTIFWFVVVSLIFAYLKGVFGQNDWAKMLFPCEGQQETICSSPTTNTWLDAITTKLDAIKQMLDTISTKMGEQTDVSNVNSETTQEIDNQNIPSTGTNLQEKPEQINKKPSTTKKPSSENNE